VTLHHFVHPQWFEALGAFEREENIGLFLDWCRVAFRCAPARRGASLTAGPAPARGPCTAGQVFHRSGGRFCDGSTALIRRTLLIGT
jgi:hypothetical protein